MLSWNNDLFWAIDMHEVKFKDSFIILIYLVVMALMSPLSVLNWIKVNPSYVDPICHTCGKSVVWISEQRGITPTRGKFIWASG